MNYQLKETALKIFKLGLEGDKTKIKFFCNYLYQLAPFNKIFSKLSTSNDYSDKARLEIILYNLAINLKSEICIQKITNSTSPIATMDLST